MKKKKKTGMLSTVIFLLLLVAVIFGCFFLAKKKAKERSEEKIRIEAQLTEAQKLIQTDIDAKYPPTAREVLKLYNRLLQCVHNEDVSDAEITSLAGQFRLLFDEDFLKNNPYEGHVESLILEVAEYDMLDRTITKCEIESSKSAAEWKNEEGSFTALSVVYTLKEAKAVAQIGERFLLRETENGRWKIVGWEPVDQAEID